MILLRLFELQHYFLYHIFTYLFAMSRFFLRSIFAQLPRSAYDDDLLSLQFVTRAPSSFAAGSPRNKRHEKPRCRYYIFMTHEFIYIMQKYCFPT